MLSVLLISCGSETKSKHQQQQADKAIEPVRINNNGTSVDYADCGSGALTVLFVHGWSIDQSYWSNQMEYFCKDYRVVSINLPGFHSSKGTRTDWTVSAYAEDVIAVIDQLKLKNVVLVGHSMGGDVVLEAASIDSTIVALVGIDTFKDVGIEFTNEVRAEIDGFLLMLRTNYSRIAPAYAENALFQPSTDSLVRKRVVDDFRTADSTVAIAALTDLVRYAKYSENQRLETLNQKLYLLNSNASPTFVDGLKEAEVDFDLFEIEATGHYPMIEKPDRFNELLSEILQQIKSSSTAE